jgi:hypothetical protein
MISNRKTCAAVPAVVLAVVLLTGLSGRSHAAGPVEERCVRLDETKIVGATCKGLIRNGCDHPVLLTVRYKVDLRRVVVLPITAEGPASKIEDAGTVEGSEQGQLAPGQSRWFAHESPGEGIEVAQCRVTFSYTWVQ